MQKWKKIGKRLLAGALSVLCFASAWPMGAFAAPRAGTNVGQTIPLVFIGQSGEEWENPAHIELVYGDRLGIEIDGSSGVDAGNNPNAWPAEYSLSLNGVQTAEGNNLIYPKVFAGTQGTQNRNYYLRAVLEDNTKSQVEEIMQNPTKEEIFTLQGNFEVLLNGYQGRLDATSNSVNTYSTVTLDIEEGDSITINDDKPSQITIKCVGDGFNDLPRFDVTATTGIFSTLMQEDGRYAKVSVDPNIRTNSKNLYYSGTLANLTDEKLVEDRQIYVVVELKTANEVRESFLGDIEWIKDLLKNWDSAWGTKPKDPTEGQTANDYLNSKDLSATERTNIRAAALEKAVEKLAELRTELGNDEVRFYFSQVLRSSSTQNGENTLVKKTVVDKTGNSTKTTVTYEWHKTSTLDSLKDETKDTNGNELEIQTTYEKELPTTLCQVHSQQSYTITLQKATTKTYTLNVKTPMSAMTDVAGYISSEVAGSVNSAQNDYVRFAQNDGPLLKANDQKKITQSFWLGANKFHYNHNFDIEWRWVPMKEAETGGGKSEDDWKNYLNNLFSIQDTNRLPSNSEYEKEGKKTAILDAIDEAAQALNQRTEENYYLSKYDIVDMDGSQAAREYAKMINVSQSITTGEDGKRGREATVSINKTEDTFGMMVATLTYELSADQMAEIKKEDGTQDNGETLIVYKSYAFPVVVEGEGKPGSVSLFSSRLGQEPNSSYTPDDGTSSQINQKGEPKFTLFSQDNQMMIQGETFQKSTQLNMSDFDGGMERDEGSRNPYNGLTDYEYVLQVNMGLYRSKAHHAVVTVSSNPDKNNQDEEKRVITVAERDGGERLPSGMGSVLADNNKTINQILSEGSRPQQDHHRWTATEDKNFNDSSLQRDTSQDTEENQDTDRYILMNNGNDDTVEYTAYLVLRARGSGVADVTVDFYDENNNLITDNLNKPASPYRLRATVQHKAPNINRTLGLVQLWAIGNGLERELELVQEPIGGGTAVTGYDPEVENYKQEVPFTYKHYQLRVPKGTINDNNTSQKVTVTVTNENGAEIPFYPVQENGQQVLKTEVKLSKDELNKGFDFYIWDNENDADKTTMDNGQGKNFNTKIGDLYSINFEVQADYKTLPTKTYHFKLRRTEASKNKNLTFLGVYYTQKDAEGDGKTRNNLLENFDPNGDKFFTKPFSYDYKTVYVLAEYDDNTYMEITYRPERETTTGREQQVVLDKLPKEAINGEVGTTLPCLKLYVDSEAEIEAAKKENKYPIEHTETLNPLDMPEYRIFFNRDEPSHNALLNSVKIYDAEALDRGEKKALPHSPTQFTADNLGPYYLTNRNAVPYSTSKLRLEITPADNRFSSIEIFVNGKPDVVITDKKEDEGKINGLIELKNKLTAQGEDGFGEEDVNIITIVVTPQDNLRPDPDAEDSGTPGENNQKTYEFRIARMPANTEPRLDPVKIMDQDDKEIRTDFHRDGTQQNGKEYELLLPYETWQISVEATPIDPNASIRLTVSPEKTGEQVTDLVKELLGDKKATLEPGKPSIKYPLNAPGNPRTFTVTGVAEDGKTVADYVFKIDREPPSTDALLKRLDVTNLTSKGLTPLFKARETEYTATLAEGQRAVTITAVPNEEHATIRIDGTLVENGKASDPIEIIDEYQKIEIVVTAQDGKTTKTYTVTVFNQNLVEKTNNADLMSLRVENGLMTPKFQPAVTEYEVAVKEDAYSVNIIPEVADPLATVKVLAGSRELGDYNGNYAMALKDGQNDVKVQVTSPDKTKTVEYTVKIFRNQEDALKNLTPLESEDVDWEKQGNPIIVSLVEYPRIAADVFTTLRDEYPEKTLVLQGVDYSFTFNAASLDTIIPVREIYDFRMSFTSPDAEKIYRFAAQWPENDDILSELVMVYFDYHGDLPGPATLNLSLSNRYGGQTLFWHYYNNEANDRDRIDYYGTVQPNSQGTFAVAVDHCSTYIVSRVHPIIGSENQETNISFIRSSILSSAIYNAAGGSGGTGVQIGTAGGSATSSSGKLNPATATQLMQTGVMGTHTPSAAPAAPSVPGGAPAQPVRSLPPEAEDAFDPRRKEEMP